MSALTAAELNRATLARQFLLERAEADPVTAISRLCALQAQSPPSPYLALWTRLRDFDAAELDRAFDDGTVLKTTLMRSTLHVVAAVDHPDFWAAHAGTLRRHRPGPSLPTALGVAEDQLTAAVEAALAHATEARTHAELTAHLRDVLGPVDDPGWWWAVAPFTRMSRVPDASAWRFGPRARFRAASTPHSERSEPESLQCLVRNYLRAFGPATVHDVATFNRLAIGHVRPAIEGDELLVRHSGPAGEPLYDVPGAPRPDGDVAAPPRFLPMWDSILLAYRDRTRIMSADVRPHAVRQNGDFLPTILVDGHVAGLWLPAEHGIEVRAFRELDESTWAVLGDEAVALHRFLAARDPRVYERYRHRWAHLPPLPTRIL